MPDRRTLLTDAAIELVGSSGLKGLTHRAVDRATGSPAGTTSNYWRTRAALLDAVVDRIEQRDLAVWAEASTSAPPTTKAELADRISVAIASMAGQNATVNRVRLMLALDRPQSVSAGHARFLAAGVRLLDAVGADDVERRARRVVDYCDGFLLHTLTTRDGAVDLDELRAGILALVG